MKAASARVVLVTAPRGRKAEELAKGLVEARLAACVNVVPDVVSYYRWREKIHRDPESILVIKTAAGRLPALKRWIAARHPYSTPEVLAVKGADGSASYLAWLGAQL